MSVAIVQLHEAGCFATDADILPNGITDLGLARSPQFHFHDLRCQPEAALRLSLRLQNELTRVEKGLRIACGSGFRI